MGTTPRAVGHAAAASQIVEWAAGNAFSLTDRQPLVGLVDAPG